MCIYCSSTEHDYLLCREPKSEEVKKVLKGIRESLTDKDEDVEMEQEDEGGAQEKKSEETQAPGVEPEQT